MSKGANEGRETKVAKGTNKGAKTKDKGKGAGVVTGQTLTVNNRKLKTINSRGDKVSAHTTTAPKDAAKDKHAFSSMHAMC